MAVKKGDTVSVNYEGKLDSGEIFDTSYHGEHNHPITFVVGENQVIKGFDDAVIGMEIDEKKSFSIKPEEAYGLRREELVREFPRSQIPLKDEPKPGMILALATPDGQQIHAVVKEVTADKIVLDLNHPLAGKNLNFTIKVEDIRDKEGNSKGDEEEEEDEHEHEESPEAETPSEETPETPQPEAADIPQPSEPQSEEKKE